MNCETCGKVLVRGQRKFCSRACFYSSPEMVKKLNTQGVARSRLFVRKSPVGGDVE